MFPLNGDTITALFLGLLLGMLITALLLFIYGLVTGHTAHKENERFLSSGIKALIREERKFTHPSGRTYQQKREGE